MDDLIGRFVDAAHVGDEEVLRQCINEGVDVNGKDVLDGTALHRVIYRGNHTLAKFLLENGADPNVQSAGTSVLHEAVLNFDVVMVNILLGRGASVDAVNDSGKKPSDYVANSTDDKSRILLKVLRRAERQPRWTKLNEEAIAFTCNYHQISQKKIEVFDFYNRLWSMTTTNLNTGAESTVVKEFNDIKDKERLHIAAENLRALHGRVNDGFTRGDQRRKQPLLPSGDKLSGLS